MPKQKQDPKAEASSIENIPRIVPVIPVVDAVIFPRMQLPMAVNQKELIALVDDAMAGDRFIGVASVVNKKEAPGEYGPEDIYRVGTVAQIVKMAKAEQSVSQLLIQGIARFRVLEFVEGKPYVQARIETFADIAPEDVETEALKANLVRMFLKMAELAPYLPAEMAEWLKTVDDPGIVADAVGSILPVDVPEKQTILEAQDVKERLKEVTRLAARQIEFLELEKKIHTQIKGDMDKSQKDYYLRQQMKAIQEELGEKDDARMLVDEYRAKIEKKGLPEEAKKEAERELDRLSRMHPSSSEYTVATTYLDWITALPWNESTPDNEDIGKAEKILDEDHYGLEKPKKRILEYLAVRKLKPDSKGPILCLAGPPGTGKTSLGRSIARALGRQFVRISLGGMHDEAEIRGHRRTYVGALPGRIIQGIRRAGVNNPVFMLDEIDKVGSDFRGDPSSALLEVLDPEQNFSFSDHYLDVPFDLSRVMFITTANMLDTIPGPLRDRMEVITLSGYTLEEKTNIANRYLIPRQREENGLSPKNIRILSSAVKEIITGYTLEAGLRNLEREIAAICRGVARKTAAGETGLTKVSAKDVRKYLGPRRFSPDTICEEKPPGVATGMAWTTVGGDILFVEALAVPGKKNLILTGQLGDVMKESALAALSFLRSRGDSLKIPADYFENHEIHVHVPAGAVPKDGPSAGVTMLTALASMALSRPVKKALAMTGEITLRGQVLPVGGIKEKVLAAYRAHVKEIILPAENEKDLDDVPAAARKAITFHLVKRMEQVLDLALFSGKGKC
ncbi:MAG: endopeptidase La [Thermodesulfobacteriota bacterium]